MAFPPNDRAFVRRLAVLALAALVLSCCGCAPRITLFRDYAEPLKEYALKGKGPDKVLVVPVRGFISADPRSGLFRSRPGVLQEVVSHLDKARRDKAVKAVVLRIDSPGGTVTDSDILYREILDFKEETGKTVVAQIMSVGASGGYYAALAADGILAHPTSITGSVGVIFITPKLNGLMDKVGVRAEVAKSGKYKDIGSPFRPSTKEERQSLQRMIDQMGGRFKALAARRRGLSEETMRTVGTGNIFTGEQALALGLVDRVGYAKDAVAMAREHGDFSKDPKLIVYRRVEYKNDNLYNTFSETADVGSPHLVDLGPAGALASLSPGFYYLWAPDLAGAD